MDESSDTPVPPLRNEIAWSRRILRSVRNVTLTTFPGTEDWPHSVTLTNGFISRPDFKFVWWSFPDTRHSLRLEEIDRAEVLIYDSADSRNSLAVRMYVRPLDHGEMELGLADLNRCRARFGISPRRLPEFTGDYPKRLYTGTPVSFSVPVPRMLHGRHIGDTTAVIFPTVLEGFEDD